MTTVMMHDPITQEMETTRATFDADVDALSDALSAVIDLYDQDAPDDDNDDISLKFHDLVRAIVHAKHWRAAKARLEPAQ